MNLDSICYRIIKCANSMSITRHKHKKQIPKSFSYESINSIIKYLRESAEVLGYFFILPKDVKESKSTVFISSGVQRILEDTIYKELLLSERYSFYVEQPVARFNYIQALKNKINSLSFVNITFLSCTSDDEFTVKIGSSFISLVESLLREKMSIRVKRITARLPHQIKEGMSIRIAKDQIEVGDLNIIKLNEKKYLIDGGIGLERLITAIYKLDDIIQVVYPQADLENTIKDKILKTLSLILLVPKLSKEQKCKTHKLLKLIRGYFSEELLYKFIRYWNIFYKYSNIQYPSIILFLKKLMRDVT